MKVQVTQGAVLTELTQPLEIWELTLPSLKPGQVCVQMAYSGVCQSQLNEIKGLKGADPYLPHTLGHEGSGIVEAIGESVTKVKLGNRVVLSWLKGQGADIPNCQYRAGKQIVNSGAISTFLAHAIISENRVIPIPKEMPLREAALLGCAIPTGAGVVKNEMNLQPGNSFVVFGAGGVGLSAILAAATVGAYPIIAVDIHAQKLALASKLGATHVINGCEEDPVGKIFALTQGKGADFVFESAGKRLAMEQAFAALKAPHGLCVLAGNLPKGEKISIDPFDLIRGKRMIGTWGGKSCIDQEVAHFSSLFLENRFPCTPLITHEVSLSEINQLLKELEEGTVGRGLIRFEIHSAIPGDPFH